MCVGRHHLTPGGGGRVAQVTRDIVTALYDCTADDSDDLAFRATDRILVLERLPGEWWRGRVVDAHGVATGPAGLFPRSYVAA
jgi:hypothetical protein